MTENASRARRIRAALALISAALLFLCACEPAPYTGPTAEPVVVQSAMPPLDVPLISPMPAATPEPVAYESPYAVLSALWQSAGDAPGDVLLMGGEALALVEVMAPVDDRSVPPVVMLIDGAARAPRHSELIAADGNGEQWALWFVAHQAARSTVIVEEAHPDAVLAELPAPGSVKVDVFDSVLGNVTLYRSAENTDIRMCAALQHPYFPRVPSAATVVAAQSVVNRSYRESRMAACNLPRSADPRERMAEELGGSAPSATDEGWTIIAQRENYLILVRAEYDKLALDVDGPKMQTRPTQDNIALLITLLAPGWNMEVAADDDPPIKGPKGNVTLASAAIVEAVSDDGKPYYPAPGNVLMVLQFESTAAGALTAAMEQWESAELASVSGVTFGAVLADKKIGTITFEAQCDLVYPRTLRWFDNEYELPLP